MEVAELEEPRTACWNQVIDRAADQVAEGQRAQVLGALRMLAHACEQNRGQRHMMKKMEVDPIAQLHRLRMRRAPSGQHAVRNETEQVIFQRDDRAVEDATRYEGQAFDDGKAIANAQENQRAEQGIGGEAQAFAEPGAGAREQEPRAGEGEQIEGIALRTEQDRVGEHEQADASHRTHGPTQRGLGVDVAGKRGGHATRFEVAASPPPAEQPDRERKHREVWFTKNLAQRFEWLKPGVRARQAAEVMHQNGDQQRADAQPNQEAEVTIETSESVHEFDSSFSSSSPRLGQASSKRCCKSRRRVAASARSGSISGPKRVA